VNASLSGGWLYLVDERGRQPHMTHARRTCTAVEGDGGELRPALVPFGTRPPAETEWKGCDVCGGARPVGPRRRDQHVR
jgi:hypothetical protein